MDRIIRVGGYLKYPSDISNIRPPTERCTLRDKVPELLLGGPNNPMGAGGLSGLNLLLLPSSLPSFSLVVLESSGFLPRSRTNQSEPSMIKGWG